MHFNRVSLGLLLLAMGCATGGVQERAAQRATAPDRTRQRLVFENASPDVVRVYLDVEGRGVLLGRVGPFETAAIIVPQALAQMGAGAARINIVPVGTPVSTLGPTGVRSEIYSAYDLLQHSWRFSGTRVMMVLRD